MSSLADFRRMGTDPYFRLAKEVSPPSLLEQKSLALQSAFEDKKARLDPAEVAAAEDRTTVEQAQEYVRNGGRSSDNYLDVAESSLYQSMEQTKDFFGLGEGVDRTNEQIRTQADLDAGLSEEGRERMVTAPQERVGESLAQGNYWDALKGGLAAAPGTISDSAGSVAGIAATSAAVTGLAAAAPLAAGALGVTALGRKLFQGAKKVDKVADAIAQVGKAKEATIGSKGLMTAADAAAAKIADRVPSLVEKTGKVIANAAKAAPKAAAQVSVATADMTQRQINDFREKHGRNPTASETAGMYTTTLMTMAVQPAIFKNFIVPKFGKEIFKEASVAVSNMGKGSNFVQMGKRLAETVLKVGAAGTAEGLQEYVQSWAEVVNVNVDATDAKSFFEGMMSQFKNKDKQLETLTAGFLGIGAGAGTKAAVSVPAATAGATLDLAKATAKGAAVPVRAAFKYSGKRAARTTLSYLSGATTKGIQNEYNLAKAEHEELKTDRNSKINMANKAKAYNDIPDQELKDEFARVAQGDDLNDPEVFKKVKALVKAGYNADVVGSMAKIEGNRFFSVIESEAKRVAKNALRLTGIKQEDVDRAIKVAGVVGSKIKREIRLFDSSASKGLLVSALEYGKDSSKAGKRKLFDFAAENSVETIRKLADIMAEDAPETSKVLNDYAANKEIEIKRSGEERDRLVNVSKLSRAVKDLANSRPGRTPSKGLAAAGRELLSDSKGLMEDVETITMMRRAIAAYKATTGYLQRVDGDGTLTEETLGGIEIKLDRREEELNSTPTAKATAAVKKAVSGSDGVVAESMNVVGKAYDDFVATLDEWVGNFVNDTETEGTVKDLEGDNPDARTVDIKTYKIKSTPQSEAFIDGLFTLSQGAEGNPEMDGQVEDMKTFLRLETTSKMLSENFGTTDPKAIAAVIGKVFPAIKDKSGKTNGYVSLLKKHLKNAKPLSDKNASRIQSTENGGGIFHGSRFDVVVNKPEGSNHWQITTRPVKGNTDKADIATAKAQETKTIVNKAAAFAYADSVANKVEPKDNSDSESFIREATVNNVNRSINEESDDGHLLFNETLSKEQKTKIAELLDMKICEI